MAEEEYKPPTSAEELLGRYAAGERDFCRAKLPGADLGGATLSGANLGEADLRGARLVGTDLSRTNLDFARLSGGDLTDANLAVASLWVSHLDGARLCRANFYRAHAFWTFFVESDLTGAKFLFASLEGARLMRSTMRGTELTCADLSSANLSGADLGGAILSRTKLLALDIAPFCDASPPVVHQGPSIVDTRAIWASANALNLKDFLQRVGLYELTVEYMVACAEATHGSLIKKLLQSTFISYGDPDEPLARKLYEALHRNGVTTFFFPEHAKPGQRIGRLVRQNVESYDRSLLLCSQASLVRPGVLYEIEETLERERRDGGAEYLIPVELDDCLRIKGAVLRKDLVRVLRDRVCADFRGAQDDEAVFQAGLRKLIAALRPPDLALWRPPGSTKPIEP